MDVGTISSISKETLITAVYIGAPILLSTLIVGILISILQSATQIQETTLAFIPKIISVFFCIIVFMPYMYKKLLIFMDHIMQFMLSTY